MVKTALAVAEPPEDDFQNWVAQLSSSEDDTVDIRDNVAVQRAIDLAYNTGLAAQRAALTVMDLINQFDRKRSTEEHRLDELEAMLRAQAA